MRFENTEAMNFKNAFRGLRNPMNSWGRSDSEFGIIEEANLLSLANSFAELKYEPIGKDSDFITMWLGRNGILSKQSSADDCSSYCSYAFIGPQDLQLAQRMINVGSSDRKFLRQIFVSVDITAPLYWYKEFDTYKISTVANSTSTMHKLSSTPITKECFEMDDYTEIGRANDKTWEIIVDICEDLRKKFNETKDGRYWKELIRILPESWLQTRTWTANYEILRNIYQQRKTHKLTEWHQFCDWILSLPYAKELILHGLYE